MSVLRDLPQPGRLGGAAPPIELFTDSRDPLRRAGRDVVRRAVLAMRSAETDDIGLPGPLGPADGTFWGLQSRNGLTVALRVTSFHTDTAARHDAAEIIARSAEWTMHDVTEQDGTAASLWIALDGRVVLVGGQSWRRAGTASAPARRRILAALPTRS